MVSKQLESIIAGLPPATISKKRDYPENLQTEREVINRDSVIPSKKEDYPENLQTEREIINRDSVMLSKKKIKIVAEVPLTVKDELQRRAKLSGETEKTILLKALKLYGFDIDDVVMADQRSLRK
jgi:hypothetical protein